MLDKRGARLGSCTVIGYPINSDHIELCPDSPDEPVVRNAERFIGRLRKAYKQFMPKALNVILFTGDNCGRTEFESALFGEFKLKRDSKTQQFSKTQTRHNGFWSGQKNSESNLAVWLEHADYEVIDFKLLIRDGYELDRMIVADLFNRPYTMK